MIKFYPWLLIALLALLPGYSQAQDKLIPKDSLEFRDFLILQGEVPGLSYRFYISDKSISDSLASDSLYRFSKTDSGFVSTLFTDFSQVAEFEKNLLGDSLTYSLAYVVFNESTALTGTVDYLSNLVRNGDYQVKFEEARSEQDLVSLASKSPYSPLQKFKLKFVSDYQLFGVTVIIVFFFLVALGMIVFMLIMKVTKNTWESLLKEYDQLIIDPLTSLLFEKELSEILKMDQKEIYTYFPQELLSKSQYKEVLIDRIIGLNKKMKGEFKEKLKALYKRLGLDKVSIESLRHKKWDRVAMALVQINEMDLVEALPEVKNFTDASNFHIRSQAVATLLNLSEKVDLVFLRDQTYPLSLWQQMNYLRIIRFVGSQKGLRLEILFDSKNQSIRIFGYKLVRMLGRVDLIDHLSKMAREVSDEEKIEILETYATVGAHMEAAFINESLRSQNQNLALAAAKAASAIGDTASAEILIELFATETIFRKKLIYLKSLYDLDRDRFTQTVSANSTPELVELRNHILDPMLQHV